MLSEHEIEEIKEKINSCQNCHHFAVCKIYHGFLLHLKSIEISDINPQNLAKICPFYSPIVVGGE